MDVFFVGRAARLDVAEAGDGVESIAWLDPRAVDPDDIAFPSMRAALAIYCAGGAQASAELTASALRSAGRSDE